MRDPFADTSAWRRDIAESQRSPLADQTGESVIHRLLRFGSAIRPAHPSLVPPTGRGQRAGRLVPTYATSRSYNVVKGALEIEHQ